MEYPYAFHIALDGNGLNGLEGRAGVCVFRYDPQTERYAYNIEYYDGMAGGHAVSVSPDRRVGFLGSTGQHLMFYDTRHARARSIGSPLFGSSRPTPPSRAAPTSPGSTTRRPWPRWVRACG